MHNPFSSQFNIVYFHTGMSKFKKGPVIFMRKLFMKLPEHVQHQLHSFSIIHPNFLLKSKISFIKALNRSQQSLMKRVKQFDSIVQYLDSIKCDPALSQRIIGVLPTELHKVYLHEKENQSKSQSFLKKHDQKRRQKQQKRR